VFFTGLAAAFLVPAMIANGMYYRRTKRIIEEAHENCVGSAAQEDYLMERGGTSEIAVVVVIALSVLGGVGTFLVR